MAEKTLWRPISTAPRDGRRVLAWSEATASYHVLGFDATPPAGWISQSGDYVILNENELSHWAGLPPPPLGEASGRRTGGLAIWCLLACAAATGLGMLLENWLNLLT